MSFNSVINTKQGWRGRSTSTSTSITKKALAALLFLGLIAPCTGWRQQQASTTARRSLRGGARVVYGVNRALHQPDSNSETDAPVAEPPEELMVTPVCATLTVPVAAGILSGSYSHSGGFNDGRPMYVNDDPFGEALMFAQAPEQGAAGSGRTVSWFITAKHPVTYYLSLEIEAYEPDAMDGPQSWVINNNNAACPAHGGPCVLEMDITCAVLTSELYTAGPTAAPTAAPTTTIALDTANSTSSSGAGGGNSRLGNETAVITTPAPSAATIVAQPVPPSTPSPTTAPTTPATTTEASWLEGCVNLDIRNGGARAGIYLLNETAISNDRPMYAVGGERTDEVFSAQMSACDIGWGVVNSTWAENKGELGPGATVREVFLMYVSGLDLPADRCRVDVWVVAGEATISLESAGEHTFISVSDLMDPTEVTSWMKYTPPTEDERATLQDNSWIDVGCAEADEVAAAEKSEDRGSAKTVPAPPVPPSGDEPNAGA